MIPCCQDSVQKSHLYSLKYHFYLKELRLFPTMFKLFSVNGQKPGLCIVLLWDYTILSEIMETISKMFHLKSWISRCKSILCFIRGITVTWQKVKGIGCSFWRNSVAKIKKPRLILVQEIHFLLNKAISQSVFYLRRCWPPPMGSGCISTESQWLTNEEQHSAPFICIRCVIYLNDNISKTGSKVPSLCRLGMFLCICYDVMVDREQLKNTDKG